MSAQNDHHHHTTLSRLKPAESVHLPSGVHSATPLPNPLDLSHSYQSFSISDSLYNYQRPLSVLGEPASIYGVGSPLDISDVPFCTTVCTTTITAMGSAAPCWTLCTSGLKSIPFFRRNDSLSHFPIGVILVLRCHYQEQGIRKVGKSRQQPC